MLRHSLYVRLQMMARAIHTRQAACPPGPRGSFLGGLDRLAVSWKHCDASCSLENSNRCCSWQLVSPCTWMSRRCDDVPQRLRSLPLLLEAGPFMLACLPLFDNLMQIMQLAFGKPIAFICLSITSISSMLPLLLPWLHPKREAVALRTACLTLHSEIL